MSGYMTENFLEIGITSKLKIVCIVAWLRNVLMIFHKIFPG